MSSSVCWHFDRFELDASERRLLKDGVPVPLEPRPFDLLLFLIQRAGELASREYLLRSIWHDVHVQDAALTNAVAILRRTLGSEAIETISKGGYRFRLPVTVVEKPSPTALTLLREGQQQMSQRSTEHVLNARDLLWLAIAEQPDFAESWAWLGRAARFLEKFRVNQDYHRKLSEVAFRRSFTLDPELNSAHQFYTSVQADRGEALEAMVRLLNRVRKHPRDAPTYSGLTQVCRFCGLLDASLAAHQRAVELDAAIVSSVPHTHFARCDYQRVVESYAMESKGARGYLDVAAWACLGSRERVMNDINDRLASGKWAPGFVALLRSLLGALRHDPDETVAVYEALNPYQDPESILYFARNVAWAGNPGKATEMLQLCIDGGLVVPFTLRNDPWLVPLRNEAAFETLLRDATRRHRQAENVFAQSGGPQLLSPTRHSPWDVEGTDRQDL